MPHPLTALIGRAHEVQQAWTLLRNPGIRLLTITGPGGIGKSRLALQVAVDVQRDFADGYCSVELAHFTTPQQVGLSIAQALGLRVRGREPFERLKTFLRERHLLLLLDNFEQVPAAAPLLPELLAACPQLKILVTSRAVLRVQGEFEFPVPPLSVPDLHHLPSLEALAHYGAVVLFVQRARAIARDFRLTEENAQDIAAICARLDGLPLAIELAAAHTKVLPPRLLLARLEKPLDVLTRGGPDLPVRQQTLRMNCMDCPCESSEGDYNLSHVPGCLLERLLPQDMLISSLSWCFVLSLTWLYPVSHRRCIDPPPTEGINAAPTSRDVQQFDPAQHPRQGRIDNKVVTNRLQAKHRAQKQERRPTGPGLRATCGWILHRKLRQFTPIAGERLRQAALEVGSSLEHVHRNPCSLLTIAVASEPHRNKGVVVWPDRTDMIPNRVVATLSFRHGAYAPTGIKFRAHQVTYKSLRLVLIDDATPEQVPNVRGQRINLAPITIDGKCEELSIFEPEVLVEPPLQFGCLAL